MPNLHQPPQYKSITPNTLTKGWRSWLWVIYLSVAKFNVLHGDTFATSINGGYGWTEHTDVAVHLSAQLCPTYQYILQIPIGTAWGVKRWWYIMGQKKYRQYPIQQLPTNPSKCNVLLNSECNGACRSSLDSEKTRQTQHIPGLIAVLLFIWRR